MLSSSTLDDLIRQQENLRLQSTRHLEELRSRQDKYRRCRFSGHRLPNQWNVSRSTDTADASSNNRKTLEDSNERHYQPVSTVIKSSSFQGVGSVPSGSNGSTVPLSQHFADDWRHINACHSASTVLSDDLNSERWSVSAARDARKKLISGRRETEMNLNNSSSVNIRNGSRMLDPAERIQTQTNTNNSSCVDIRNGSRVFHPVSSMSSTFMDSNGCKAPELDTASAGYFSSDNGDIGKLDCSVTPQKSDQSLEGTPKSILRHRQIIDRNVYVESKFNHTPTNVRSRKHRRGLNFSYSDVDDAELFGRKTKSVNFDVDLRKSTTESSAEDNNSSSLPNTSSSKVVSLSSVADDTLPASQRFYYAPDATNSMETSVDTSESSAVRKTVSDGLLLQTGNDRQNAKIVQELESRSRSDLFSSDQPLPPNTSTNAQQSQVLHIVFLHLEQDFLLSVSF